jgi:hypothetical protein
MVGIMSFRKNPNFTSLDVFVYRNVKVIGIQCSNEGCDSFVYIRFILTSIGIVYRVSFEIDQEVNWACSSRYIQFFISIGRLSLIPRLLYGSLICLSPDDFETLYWASVQVRDVDLLTKKQQVDIRFPEGIFRHDR